MIKLLSFDKDIMVIFVHLARVVAVSKMSGRVIKEVSLFCLQENKQFIGHDLNII